MSVPGYEGVALSGLGVALRPWRPEDESAYLRVYSDPVIARWLYREPIGSLDEARAALASVIARSREMPAGLGIFALVPDAVGHPVGSLILKPLEETGLVEIGWHQAEPWTGKGHVTSGARLLLRHAYQVVGLPQVHAIILPDNERSLGVARRLRLRETGALLTVRGLTHLLLRQTADEWRDSDSDA